MSEDRYQHWYAFIESWRISIVPLQREALAILGHAVGYAQMALKTALLLNGGGLIAIPAFAKLTGTIWARGLWPPMISMGSFLLGIIFAAVAIAFSFFVMLAANRAKNLEIHRRTEDVGEVYKAMEEERPAPSVVSEPSDEETALARKAGRLQNWAIVFGIGSLTLFVIGALSGAYILSCGEASLGNDGALVCSGDRFLPDFFQGPTPLDRIDSAS